MAPGCGIISVIVVTGPLPPLAAVKISNLFVIAPSYKNGRRSHNSKCHLRSLIHPENILFAATISFVATVVRAEQYLPFAASYKR
jgi:hypothetical protein